MKTKLFAERGAGPLKQQQMKMKKMKEEELMSILTFFER